jgi:hypothetical protein
MRGILLAAMLGAVIWAIVIVAVVSVGRALA